MSLSGKGLSYHYHISISKQSRPRSGSSYKSCLIWVCSVCKKCLKASLSDEGFKKRLVRAISFKDLRHMFNILKNRFWRVIYLITNHLFIRTSNNSKTNSKILSEYDQEIPQSQTADNPMSPRGRATQPYVYTA